VILFGLGSIIEGISSLVALSSLSYSKITSSFKRNQTDKDSIFLDNLKE